LWAAADSLRFRVRLESLGLHEGKKNRAEHGIESHALVSWDHVLSAGFSKKYFTSLTRHSIGRRENRNK